jgi:predicted transglutaminase-like cysteine proteinase
MALGWRPEELRIAVAWTEQGDYHVVLTVDGLTKKGVRQTYVLDNRFSHVETWSTLTRLGYRWDRRQDKTGQHWVAIAPKR